MASVHYDLIVIGSGPAGEKGAAQAAYFGKRTAMIEKEPYLGGAGANTGTLPSKTLRETAVFLSGFRHRELTGLDVRMIKPGIRDFMTREVHVKDRQRKQIRWNMDRHRVMLFQGSAAFQDPHTLSVTTPAGEAVTLSADVFLVATGSTPFRPPAFDFHDSRIHDSDTILEMGAMPARLLVVGGGVIGCEYACMFAVMGIQVTLVEKRPVLVGFLDDEVAQALKEQMTRMGVTMIMPDSVAHVRAGDKGLHVELESGAKLLTDRILVSSGRCGNTQGLGLEQIGVSVDERGRIAVNEHYQTSVPHIYAAGDVIGSPALASTSMQQARVAMVHAFQLLYLKSLPNILPYGIYTIPECSMAGETEQDLRKKGVPCVAGKASYGMNLRGQIIGDNAGFLKLIYHLDDMKLLGVHMIGEQATEVVHVGLTAMLLGATADLFIQSCYNFPTLTELYKYATYDALGRCGR